LADVEVIYENENYAIVDRSADGKILIRNTIGQTVTALASDLMPVKPVKNDKIVLIGGDRRGEKGDLKGVQEDEGVVRFKEIELIVMNDIAKIANF